MNLCSQPVRKSPSTKRRLLLCTKNSNIYPLAFLIAVCQYIGMFCILCNNSKTQVVNTRASQNDLSIWRRRHCASCNGTFTTYERPAQSEYIQVVDSNDNASSLSVPHLTLSIASYLPSRGKAEEAYALATTVVQKIIKENTGTVSTSIIAKKSYEILKAYNPSAGVQYGLAHGVLRPASSKRRAKPKV